MFGRKRLKKRIAELEAEIESIDGYSKTVLVTPFGVISSKEYWRMNNSLRSIHAAVKDGKSGTARMIKRMCEEAWG